MFKPFQYRRLAAIVLLVLAGLVWVCDRLFDIQITRHRELLVRARQYAQSRRVLEARRGEIRDRNGVVVAISTPVKSIYLNPALCSNRLDQVAQTIGPLLEIPPEALAERVRSCLQRSDRGAGEPQKALLLRHNVPVDEWRGIATALDLEMFGLGKPNLSAAEQAQLRKLRHQILFARDTQSRSYPGGESLCQVLGFVSSRTNGSGLAGACGIERSCDEVLAGKDGECLSQQDAAGNELPAYREHYEMPTDGNRVVLTVDLRLQRIVEQALASARTQYRARGVSAIVMDPKTFEVLALACCPGFNPQNPGASTNETWRNGVFTDMVEPGSILKFIPLAGALELGLTTLDSRIYCEHGLFVVNKVPVHDHAPYGLLTCRQCFAKSSNIAFSKIGLALGPERLYRCMTNFGLARCPGVPFADETSGRICLPRTWTTMSLTRAAFGQGVSVSQLQMAVAMCVIANNGRMMRPYLVSRIESPQGQILRQYQPQFVRSVVSPQTAQQVTEALKAVVSPEGTGNLAALDRYTVAAKTGTAQKSDGHSYVAGRYYSSMIGFFPADAPRFVIAVALDEPQNGYYAGTVAAPVFRSIAEQIAACLQIPPDKGTSVPAGNTLARPTPSIAQPAPLPASRVPVQVPNANHAFASTPKR